MKRALVIGLNDYPNGNELNGCVNDALEIGKRLERHGNGDKNFDVQTIVNKCSRSLLKTSVDKCFEGNVDVALFYFAGHGYLDSFGGKIIATDNSNADLSLTEILNVVNNSACKNKVVIFDSCHSGAMGNPSSSNDVLSINSGVTILTACTQQQPSAENEDGSHGVFTELLLAALDGEAADLMGNITLGGIYAFIDKSLGAWDVQRPVFKTNVTTFSPLRVVKAPIDIQILRNLAGYFQTPNTLYSLDPSYEFENKKDVVREPIEPYGDDENIRIMKELQKLERVGLVVPHDTEHMYHAAMESKSCKLTTIGKHYWRLAKTDRI